MHQLPAMLSRYVGVYRVNAPAPLEDVQFPGLTFRKGPFELERSAPLLQFGPGSASFTMGVERIPFGSGVYLLVIRELDLVPAENRSRAALLIAEQAALLDLLFPELIAEKQFEGVVNTPGQRVFAPDGPMTLTARPFEGVDALVRGLESGDGLLQSLSPGDRDRFRLASRWFRRGCETVNLVDRFLFWYIALEVYPATGDTDVPKHVRNLIHARVYPNVDAGVVKERIGIGPAAGLRARIVHDGLSVVPTGEREMFEQRLAQLNALVRTCLRLLLGVAPGSDLDRWVNGSQPLA